MSRLGTATPFVSIITPTFNHEAFISECIESVLAQAYQRWEMLIVDDGSTDRTWDIVQGYATLDARIRPTRQANKGIWRLSETYNAALAQARGRLIAILEGDDYWPSHKLDTQVQTHEAVADLVLSHGGVEIIETNGVTRQYCTPPNGGVQTSERYLKYALERRSCLMPVSVMIDRGLLLEIGGFCQPVGFPAVDYPTFLRLLQVPGRVVFIDSILGYWRQSSSQVTQQRRIDLASVALDIALDYHAHLPPDLRAMMSLTPRGIRAAHYRRTLTPALLGAMRDDLRARRSADARLNAIQLMLHGTFKRKLQGAFGVVDSLLGLDLEALFRLYEKVMLRSRARA